MCSVVIESLVHTAADPLVGNCGNHRAGSESDRKLDSEYPLVVHIAWNPPPSWLPGTSWPPCTSWAEVPLSSHPRPRPPSIGACYQLRDASGCLESCWSCSPQGRERKTGTEAASRTHLHRGTWHRATTSSDQAGDCQGAEFRIDFARLHSVPTRGGHINRLQFRVCRSSGGWTNLGRKSRARTCRSGARRCRFCVQSCAHEPPSVSHNEGRGAARAIDQFLMGHSDLPAPGVTLGSALAPAM
jgi:hypothetical protein